MTQKNRLQVQYIEISKIIPYARNSRTHTDEQIAQVAASIREFGFTNPILVADDHTVVAGHGRLLAAQRLNLSTVPVIALSDMDEAQRRAYCIADNKLAENAGWDDELLAVEFSSLDDLHFDLALTGFSLEEINALRQVPDFDAGNEDDQGQLDELAPKIVTCPHCGKEFDSRG